MMVGVEPKYPPQLDIILSIDSKCIEYTDLSGVKKSETFETHSQLDKFMSLEKSLDRYEKEILGAFHYAFWLEHERDKREYDPLFLKRNAPLYDSRNNVACQSPLRCVD